MVSIAPFSIPDEFRQYLTEETIETLEFYFTYGEYPTAGINGLFDGFYYELLSGDYERAALSATEQGVTGFPEIVRLLHEHAPKTAFGSPEIVAAYRGLAPRDPRLDVYPVWVRSLKVLKAAGIDLTDAAPVSSHA